MQDNIRIRITQLKQTSDQSSVNRRLNKHISHRNSFVHADIWELVYDGHHNDASSASTVNKLWFSVESGCSPRKRRRPHFAAFLAYSHNDSDFVTNKLYEPLQKYLCGALPHWSQDTLTLLYDKHFLPGQPLNEICRAAVHDSHVIIAIVSDSFIQSPWCLYEMENAVTADVPIIPLYLTHRDITCFSGIMKHVYDKHVRTFWPPSKKVCGSMTNEEIDVSFNSEGHVDDYDTISNTGVSVVEENGTSIYDSILDSSVNDYEEIDDMPDAILRSTMKRTPKQCCEWFAMFRW